MPMQQPFPVPFPVAANRMRLCLATARRQGANFAILCIAAWGSFALAGQRTDDALLLVEQPQWFYQQMPVIAGSLGPMLEVSDKGGIAAVTERGAAYAKSIYDSAAALRQIGDALKASGDQGDNERFIEAASHFDAARAAFDAKTLEQLQAQEPEILARLAARADRAAIAAIARAMAGPEFEADTALTGQRLKGIYETLITLGKSGTSEMRAMSQQELEQGVDTAISLSRAGAMDSQQVPPLQRGFRRDSARLRREAILSTLSTADIVQLRSFYSGKSGRAKVSAMIKAFHRCNDRDGRAMLLKLLEDVRQR